MKSYARDAPHLHEVLGEQFFQPAEDRFPWLRSDAQLPKGDIELLHSPDGPLWTQVATRLGSQAVKKIAVVSPFYDQDIDLLKRLRRSWPDAALTFVAQQNYATLAGKKLAKLFASGKKGRLLAATPKLGRRLHAKAFAFETRQATFWLTGSPNATLAAFDGLNSEAAIWFRSKENVDALFDNDQITFEEMAPTDFEAGAAQEHDVEPLACEVRLNSAILSEQGELECTFDTAKALRDTALRIRNFNDVKRRPDLTPRRHEELTPLLFAGLKQAAREARPS
jgi:hypothetical protein